MNLKQVAHTSDAATACNTARNEKEKLTLPDILGELCYFRAYNTIIGGRASFGPEMERDGISSIIYEN